MTYTPNPNPNPNYPYPYPYCLPLPLRLPLPLPVPRRVARKYAASWFVVDVLVVLPLDVLLGPLEHSYLG